MIFRRKVMNEHSTVGKAFYQEGLYWATDDVNALYPYYEGFHEQKGVFLVTVIRQEEYKFSYG